jgi:hypothetical protein
MALTRWFPATHEQEAMSMPDTDRPVITYDDLIRAEDLWLDQLADDSEFYPHPAPATTEET